MKQETVQKEKLPEGWNFQKMITVVDKRKSGIEKFEGKRRYVSTGDLQGSELSFTDITFENRPSRANMEGKEGDVIFAKMKDTNKVLLITEELSRNIYSTGFYVLIPKDLVLSKFLYYYLKSDYFMIQKNKLAKGATQKAINDDDLAKIMILLPPIKIQQQIITKLDAQMAQIEMMKIGIEGNLKISNSLFDSYLSEIFEKISTTKKLGELITTIQNGIYKPDEFRRKGIKLVRMYNIDNSSIILNDHDLQEIELSEEERKKFTLT